MPIYSIFTGLGIGFFAAVCYALTRRYVSKPGRTAIQYLVMSQIIMASASVAILPFCWRTPVAGWRAMILPVLGAVSFYLLGQLSLFYALRHAPSSCTTPFLSVKVPLLALISFVIFDKHITSPQWIAVGFTVVAAFMLRSAGGRLPFKTLFSVLLSCSLFALSDLSIRLMHDVIDPHRTAGSIAFSVAVSYTVGGILSLPLLFTLKGTGRQEWKEAVPYALCWYSSMFCFYGTIAIAGLVFSGIMQSLRGIFAIIFAVFIARSGHHEVEHEVKTIERIKQFAAAGLMTAAVALFMLFDAP